MPEPKYCHNLLRLTLVSQDQSGGAIQMQLLGGPIGIAQNIFELPLLIGPKIVRKKTEKPMSV